MDSIKSKNGMIELNMAEAKKGHAKIKMSALKICGENETNKNLIRWKREYVEKNIETIIGSDYVVSFLNGVDGCPNSHGEMARDEDGKIYFKDSVVVGHIEEARIETEIINGVEVEVLNTFGFISSQRYPDFVKWLVSEVENDQVCGSIEINPKVGADSITYEENVICDEKGNMLFRTPIDFSFTALAILCKEICEPADNNSVVMSVEVASLNQNVMDYSVSDNKNEEGDSNMNQEQFDAKITEINQLLASSNEEVARLNKAISDKDKSLVEVNEIVVEANKTQEELSSKIETMTKELEECKAELQAYKEKEAQTKEEEKKAEINSYMENEISKNGFTETEINSFAELVEACDLNGIKKLESELCTAKFKAEINAKKEVEVNSKEDDKKDVEVFSMFTTKEPKKVVIGDEIPTLM